jgi:hypothetical protein
MPVTHEEVPFTQFTGNKVGIRSFSAVPIYKRRPKFTILRNY